MFPHAPTRCVPPDDPGARLMPPDDFADEIDRLEARSASDPRTHTFARLADLYRKAGELERALEVVESGLRHHPHYLNARIVHARLLRELGRRGDAVIAFEHVLQIDSQNLVAQAALTELRQGVRPVAPEAPAAHPRPAASGWLSRLEADWRSGRGEELPQIRPSEGVPRAPEPAVEPPEPEGPDAAALEPGPGPPSSSGEAPAPGSAEVGPTMATPGAPAPSTAAAGSPATSGSAAESAAEPGPAKESELAKNPGPPEAREPEEAAPAAPEPAAGPEPASEPEPVREREPSQAREPDAAEPKDVPAAPGSGRTTPREGRDLETATLAELYARQGLFGEAIGILERLLARDPYDARLAAALDDARRQARGKGSPGTSKGHGAEREGDERASSPARTTPARSEPRRGVARSERPLRQPPLTPGAPVPPGSAAEADAESIRAFLVRLVEGRLESPGAGESGERDVDLDGWLEARGA